MDAAMLKKLFTTTIALGASLSFAGTMGVATKPSPLYNYQASPYIGASIGDITNNTTLPAAYRGIQGTLSGGYGILFNHVYLAGEVFGGSNANIKDMSVGNLTVTSVRSSWFYGGDIIPGFMINDSVLAYLRGGVIRTYFNNVRQQSTGWQAGGGLQTSIYKNLDIRGEYVFSEYQRIGRPGFTPVGKPLSDQFNLGLVYKFV